MNKKMQDELQKWFKQFNIKDDASLIKLLADALSTTMTKATEADKVSMAEVIGTIYLIGIVDAKNRGIVSYDLMRDIAEEQVNEYLNKTIQEVSKNESK